MGSRVRIFYPELRRLMDSPDDVRADGATVGECLADLARRYPGAGDLLFDDRGRLRPPVYVFVNIEGMYKADLARPVDERDELIVAVLATGG